LILTDELFIARHGVVYPAVWYSGVRHVLDGIEFYPPRLAHMIFHLKVERDDAILERFALVIAQQPINVALQLNGIWKGASRLSTKMLEFALFCVEETLTAPCRHER
jgi:hypothetical protein